MQIAFKETSGFTESIDEYFGGDEHYRRLQLFLTLKPEAGAVIRGTGGGVRKVRWPDPRRGKGTRGGLRILYCFAPEGPEILLIDVYDKNEKDDISSADARAIGALAKEYREQVDRGRQR